MPAYLIVDIRIRDPKVYEQYKALTPAAIAAFGGRFVVRGGACETLEGDWRPQRLVVIEFESMAKAREFWSSDIYAPALALRQASADTNMILVEGV